MKKNAISRRAALKAGVLVAVAATPLAGIYAAEDGPKPKGNVNHSLCKWCYPNIKLEKLADETKKLGYTSIELLGPEEIKTVKGMGMTCAVMRSATPIDNGFNRKENHDKFEKALRADIEFAVAEKIPNVLCMSGNRKGMADDEGMKNCAEGIKRVMKFAEEQKITVLMEGLNSKVNHKDYMYDTTKWGVGLCKMIASPRFKLLYDIYHMQIMEGDIIRTIKDNKEYIGHYHTGGNPGRNEIDDSQEIYYPAIMKAIVATGFQGFVAQEFLPKRDAYKSLAQAFQICDV